MFYIINNKKYQYTYKINKYIAIYIKLIFFYLPYKYIEIELKYNAL